MNQISQSQKSQIEQKNIEEVIKLRRDTHKALYSQLQKRLEETSSTHGKANNDNSDIIHDLVQQPGFMEQFVVSPNAPGGASENSRTKFMSARHSMETHQQKFLHIQQGKSPIQRTHQVTKDTIGANFKQYLSDNMPLTLPPTRNQEPHASKASKKSSKFLQ